MEGEEELPWCWFPSESQKESRGETETSLSLRTKTIGAKSEDSIYL